HVYLADVLKTQDYKLGPQEWWWARVLKLSLPDLHVIWQLQSHLPEDLPTPYAVVGLREDDEHLSLAIATRPSDQPSIPNDITVTIPLGGVASTGTTPTR
ncbi:MAG TPA: hypothetical protein VMU03_01375, partial [Gammaproteobacteria bacterium]|nr:hypothetical protein [Gammaproteobacteria bacterium]